MIKLLFFQQETMIGGAETQLQSLCKSLPKEKYEITLATTIKNTQTKFFKEYPPNVKIVSVSDSEDFARTVRGTRPDIVQHFHNNIVAKGLDLADFKGKGIEVVHGRIHFPNDVTQTDKKYTNHVIAVSEDAQQFFLNVFPDWFDKVTVIPNGVDTERFNVAPFRNRAGPIVILHCGRLCEGDKQYKKIIDACKTLPIAWELRLVGTGSDMKEIFDYAAKQTPGRVKFYGFRENVEELYKEADIYISRSPSEGFGLSIAEAAACGLPLILWDCGGVTKHLTHNTSAMISQKEEHFVNSLKLAATSAEVRFRLRVAARRAAVAQFSIKSMAISYDNLYQKLIYGSKAEPAPIIIAAQAKENTIFKRILGISNPNFAGVTHATRAWTNGNTIEVAPNTPLFCSKLVQNILDKNPEVVILGGDSGYLPVIKELRQSGFKGKVILTWHGTFSFNAFAPKDSELLADWMQALKNGLIDRIGFVRPEMHKAVKHTKAVYFPNRIPLRTIGTLPTRMGNGNHIGIFGTGYPWKNMEQLVIAASLIPNSVIHVNKFESKLASTLGIKVVSHEVQAQEKFYRLLGAMDCNIQGGFTESFGLTFCESLRLGVPCLTTPGVQVLQKKDLYIDRNPFEVGDPDNITAVADKIVNLIGEEKDRHLAWGNVQLDRQSELNNKQIEKVLYDCTH